MPYILRRISRYTAVLFASSIAFTLSTSANAQEKFDWKRYSGTTISVSLKKIPWTDSLTPHIPAFEELTGIKVKLDVLPENQQREKLTVALSSGNADIDVYDTQRHNEGRKYLLAGWYEPLDKYVKDPSLAAPDFDFPGDFIKSAIDDQVIEGVLTAIPTYTEATILGYRKDLFDAAGLKAPATLDELEADAKALTDKSKGQYGICLRGLGPAASGIVGSFFHSTGGRWTDDKYNPALTSPGAIKGFELYGRLAREYGPPGILNYHWFQCQALFASGKAAMWIDANSVMNPLLDPTKSQVADKTAFAVMPAGEDGQRPGFGTHGLSIFTGSAHKEAAYLFIEWAMSKQNALNAQLIGVPSARRSPWSAPEVQKDTTYAQLRDITVKTMDLPTLSSFSPPWVAVGQIRDIIGQAIVASIQGDDVAQALQTATDQIQEVRRKTEKVEE
jgi:multiple sugar transport system substrate-binding protein